MAPVAPRKPLPPIVTGVPPFAGPLSGRMLAIDGRAVNVAVELTKGVGVGVLDIEGVGVGVLDIEGVGVGVLDIERVGVGVMGTEMPGVGVVVPAGRAPSCWLRTAKPSSAAAASTNSAFHHGPIP